MQKVRGYTNNVLPLLVSVRFQTLFHSPARGSFHLSLTVLCTIGHQLIFSLGGWSPQIPNRFLVSGGTRDTSRACLTFAYGAITLFSGPFQSPQLVIQVSH